MVAIAKSEVTQQAVISDGFSSSEELKQQCPGKFSCFYCGGELYPVRAGFRKNLVGNLELEVFHSTYFRHSANGAEHCLSSRGQSLEHMLSIKFFHDKLVKASRDHFKGAVVPSYEPLLKTIDVTRRPDIGLVYEGKVIGACEAQLSQVSDRIIVERSNDHLSLGMSGSWWGMECSSSQLDSLLRTYGSAYTLQIYKKTEFLAVHHPTFGSNYQVPVDIPKVTGFTFWTGSSLTDTHVPDDYYAQFIESMLRKDKSFACHNEFIQLDPLHKKIVRGRGKKKLIPFEEVCQSLTKIKGVEVRGSDSNVLGVIQNINGGLATVLTPQGLAIVQMNCLYVDQNILDACLSAEQQEKQYAMQVIASFKQEQTRNIQADLIANSNILTAPTQTPQIAPSTVAPQIKPRNTHLIKAGCWVEWVNAPYWWGGSPAQVKFLREDKAYLDLWKDPVPLGELTFVRER